jgi:hypothetical protein
VSWGRVYMHLLSIDPNVWVSRNAARVPCLACANSFRRRTHATVSAPHPRRYSSKIADFQEEERRIPKKSGQKSRQTTFFNFFLPGGIDLAVHGAAVIFDNQREEGHFTLIPYSNGTLADVALTYSDRWVNIGSELTRKVEAPAPVATVPEWVRCAISHDHIFFALPSLVAHFQLYGMLIKATAEPTEPNVKGSGDPDHLARALIAVCRGDLDMLEEDLELALQAAEAVSWRAARLSTRQALTVLRVLQHARLREEDDDGFEAVAIAEERILDRLGETDLALYISSPPSDASPVHLVPGSVADPDLAKVGAGDAVAASPDLPMASSEEVREKVIRVVRALLAASQEVADRIQELTSKHDLGTAMEELFAAHDATASHGSSALERVLSAGRVAVTPCASVFVHVKGLNAIDGDEVTKQLQESEVKKRLPMALNIAYNAVVADEVVFADLIPRHVRKGSASQVYVSLARLLM